MIIAQITDTHILPEGKIAFGTDTDAALARCVAQLNALDPAPDLVLHTGDLIDRGTPEEYARFRDAIAGLKHPFCAIPGNHDARDPMRAAFAGSGWMPQDDGFVQYTIEDLPCRLIALDSLIPRRGHGELCDERLDWLEARLADAPERPTLVAVHHPPFATGLQEIDRNGFGGAERLAAILSGHRQVQRLVCGHVHRSMQTLFGGTIASTAPSAAYEFVLDLRTGAPLAWNHEPPGFDLHVWDGTRLITHTAAIGDYGAHPFLKDGKWISQG